VNRLLSALAVAALVVSALAVMSPAQAEGTLKAHREYGEGPVIIPPGVDRVILGFRGRKGDIVRVAQPCDRVALRGPSGTVDRWLRGAWRLPSSDGYAFVLTGCQTLTKAFAQLTKIRLRSLRVDGAPRVVVDRSRGAYGEWTTVVVPRRGRVQVRLTSTPQEAPWCALYVEGYPMLDMANWHQEYESSPRAIYLKAGVPVSNELGTMAPWGGGTPVPRAGQRVVLGPCEDGLRARATRTRLVPGTLDGAPVAVAAERRYQEVGLRFRSASDQWVTATVEGRLTSRSMPELALTGPDGSTLVGLKHATFGGFPDLWYLPEAGSYRLMVRTDAEHRTGTVSLSSVRELAAEVPSDGQPLAFTAQEPGEWVVAIGELFDPPRALSAEAVGTTEWQAFADLLPLQLCRSAFCADGSSAFLSPESSTSYFPLSVAGRYLYLVAFGPGQTGTVSLRLTAPPAPGAQPARTPISRGTALPRL
jgi:hypothetical protein